MKQAKTELAMYLLEAASVQFDKVESAAAERSAEIEKMLLTKLDTDTFTAHARTVDAHFEEVRS